MIDIADVMAFMSETGKSQVRLAIELYSRKNRILKNEYHAAVKAWRESVENQYAEYLEFNPHLDLVNEVYEKDIAFSTVNTADEDLPF